MRLVFVAALLLVLAVPAGAEETLTVFKTDGDNPPTRMLRAYLLTETRKAFDARRTAVAALKTPEDVQKRQKELRAKFVEALGGFPDKTPLNAQVIGIGHHEGYRAERVVYESRPDHHVTATLYLPEGKGPFPAVLMPIGHSGSGKADTSVQRIAILLARNGLAALPYDPIGQGERRQLLDDQKKPMIPSITSEHTMAGIGALLVGRSTASYRIWDGIRSLDYLASRPEIDAKRLGCTGCSGGGTLTAYLMALDERVAVAAPSCYVTSLERLFATIGPQDAEQNITGQVAFGMEHADYLTMRAPRPTLLCAATRDFFDIQGTWTSFREAKRVYGLIGFPERVDLVESDSGHGYPKTQREAMLRWMRRWLLKIDDAPAEGAIAVAKESELRCTRTGQVLEDFKGKSVFGLNAERAAELAKERAKARGRNELLEDVARLSGLRLPVAAAKMTEVGEVKRNGYRIRKLVFETGPGVQVPGLLFDGGRGPLVIYADGAGKSVAAAPGGPAEKLMKDGSRVLALDLRGMGETAPGQPSKGRPNYFGTDYFEAFVSLHLGRPLLGQRATDLLAVVATMAGESEDIQLIGVGSAGPAALHAAALEPRIKRLTLADALVSWSAVVRTPISHNQLTNVVPGALAVYDLPDLAASMAPRPLTIRKPADPTGKPLAQATADDAYRAVRAAYAKARVEKQLVIAAEE
ncbi:MAG TPA: acetylxylan esterase [Gemmataceae bacterium]|jgi:cephalosporin-C deacetylase-like acetyl esterase